MWREWLKTKRFGNFYIYFCQMAMDEWVTVGNAGIYSVINYQMVAECCYEMIKDIPIRTLIYDMHMANSDGKLVGNTDAKKYCFYNEELLSEREYILTLEKMYPELFRILFLRIGQCISYLKEIANNLSQDKGKVVEQLCNGVNFNKIEKLNINLSDPHNGGKTVAKIELDNGCKIVYKPHGLWKELQYQNVYDFVCTELKLENKKIQYIDEKDHGWENWVEPRECQDGAAIKRYYFRLGIHLFLGYLLAATDLHAENVIADGEFPIILDMETYPGIRRFDKIETSEEKAKNIIEYSVMRTGMLPVSNFGKEKSVFVNAIHPAGIQEGTVEIPVIENDLSVNMKIGYKKPVVDLKCSLPMMNGRETAPYLYTKELIDGFTAAFMLWLERKNEILEYVQPLLCQRFRVVVRNTQQYAMRLSLSLHPQFLVSKEARKTFLQRLRKGNSEINEISKRIEDYEIESLLDVDIPIFYGEGLNGDLSLGNKEKIINYYKKSHVQNAVETMTQLTITDLEIQKGIIGLAMAQIKPKNVSISGVNTGTNLSIKESILKIADYLCNTAIIDKQGEVTWVGVWGGELPMGKFVPLGDDLYNGIPGVAIFLEKLLKVYSEEQYKRLLDLVKNRMFAYTIKRVESAENSHELQQKKDKYYNYTGAMLGIASNVYAYLILYKISGDSEYLKYAEEHGKLLANTYMNDEAFDFLSGNAGAVYVLCRLYYYTQKEKYLNLASQIGDWLWGKATKTEYGWGWIIPGQKIPLTGMSHGNSGFILAYSELLKYTGNIQYKSIIEELLRYENHFYSEKIKNWIDLRGCDRENEECLRHQTTWCHGSPGILISRIELQELEMIDERDVYRVLESIVNGRELSSMCLCHGNVGNWLILKYCVERGYEDNEHVKKFIRQLEEKNRDTVSKWDTQQTEKFQIGLMDGITGIGYGLLNLKR